MKPHEPRKPHPEPAPGGRSAREYGHSSGDRNTKHEEGDWKTFEGGRQRDPAPEAPAPKGRRH